MPVESYRRRFRSLLLCSCDVIRAPVTPDPPTPLPEVNLWPSFKNRHLRRRGLTEKGGGDLNSGCDRLYMVAEVSLCSFLSTLAVGFVSEFSILLSQEESENRSHYNIFLQLKKRKKKKRRKTPFSDVIPMQRIQFHFTCKRGCQ